MDLANLNCPSFFHSETAHSLTMDDILSPDCPSKRDGDGNDLAKTAMQTGVMLMIAPLFSFFRGLFKRNRGDDPPVTDLSSKQPPEMNPQTQVLARGGQEMSRSISRKSSRLAAQSSMESSRSLAGAYAYVPGDPVS